MYRVKSIKISEKSDYIINEIRLKLIVEKNLNFTKKELLEWLIINHLYKILK